MSEHPLSEETVLERIRQAERRRVALLWVLSLLFFALAGGIWLTEGVARGPRTLLAVAGAAIIVAVIAVGLRLSRPPAEASDPVIVNRRADALQRRRLAVLVLMPIAVLCEIPGAMDAAEHIGRAAGSGPRLVDVFKVAAFLVIGALALQAACTAGFLRRYAPVMNDELSRLHRDSSSFITGA